MSIHHAAGWTAAVGHTYSDFAAAFPAYAETAAIDELRATEYSRLDRLGHVYLDYTGGGQYAASQLRDHLALLNDGVYGNPHSNNPTSLAMTELVEQARAAVLAFFNADPAEYTAIFTPNASGALKLVGEAYPFQPGGRYALTFDNHNSVNGIREYARRGGATVHYIPVRGSDLRVDPALFAAHLAEADPAAHNLLAFPAQSNFSGVQHPLTWVADAQAQGWDVLLDAAAFAPTNRLDLAAIQPDFVPLSFYKIFGYPTGVGCLLARRRTLAKLQRPWFAGGTITIASVQGEGWHYLLPGAAGFEDGTVNYLNLPAVAIGLRHIAGVGIDTIHARVHCLAGWLLAELQALRHSNGAPLAHIFGPQDMAARGATVAFYLLDPTGQPYDVRRLELLAGAAGISLRTGCFCNPGDGEVAHDLRREEMAQCFVGHQGGPVLFAEFYETIRRSTGKTPSTMRVSLGVASNYADVARFLDFAYGFCDIDAAALDSQPIASGHHQALPDAA